MGNQQRKTDDSQIGWLAGFVDGEGSFNIHRHERQAGWVGWRPWFTLGNTHQPTLERVVEILKAHDIAHHVSWSQDQRQNRLPLWRISITGLKRMERWLRFITPHLFTKRRQAETMLEFVELRLANPGWRRGLSNEEQALVPRLTTMNHGIVHRPHAEQAS